MVAGPGCIPEQTEIEKEEGYAAEVYQHRQVSCQGQAGKIVFSVQQIDIKTEKKYGNDSELLFRGKIDAIVQDSGAAVGMLHPALKGQYFKKKERQGGRKRQLRRFRDTAGGKYENNDQEVQEIVIDHGLYPWSVGNTGWQEMKDVVGKMYIP
jgi:hypothetical protein